MRLLYIDAGSFQSHYNYNYGILRNFPDYVKIDICAAKNYIQKDAVRFFRYYEIPEKYIYKFDENRKYNQVYMRRIFAKAYIWVRHHVPLKKYDVIFFGYTECISFWFIFNRCRQKVLFVDHEIGNTKINCVKNWFFTHINKRYNFIAFEDYIKEYAFRQLHIKNKIWVVRHPLPEIDVEKADVLENKKLLFDSKGKFVIFAPALSNSEEFIDLLIRSCEKIPDSVNITIRSKRRTFLSEKLHVYSEYIPQDIYVSSLAVCSAVLIHYGDEYNYRTSGVLYEAVRSRKPILMYSNNTLDYYAKTYSDIIFPFYEDREFFKMLMQAVKFCLGVRKESFDKIQQDYSDETIQKELADVLEGV